MYHLHITAKKLFLILLVVYILHSITTNVEFFSVQDPVLNELKNQLAELHPRFKNVELYVGDKSYTINKQKVYICMKDRHGRYYSRNMLCYVILHEYAHMICKDLHHGGEFPATFQRLLDQAAAKGLYDPSIPPLDDYCGHD